MILCGLDAPFDFAQGRLCPTHLNLGLKYRKTFKDKTKVKSVGQECLTHTFHRLRSVSDHSFLLRSLDIPPAAGT